MELRKGAWTASAATRRVLVAGTAEFEGEMLRRALERCGYAVECAHDADAVVLSVLARIPDAMVVSENLPAPTRMALLGWLRRTPRVGEIPVVMLCGHSDPEHAVREYDAGADLVVFKPVDIDLLGRKLAAVIRRAATHPDRPRPPGPDSAG